MSFILWGGLLAVIPLIVHLMRRQKPTPIAWGAMQFLMETPLKMKRRQRIDHWVLMLLRMAILVFLALLLGRPTIAGNSYSSSSPMDVAIVIDHSLSMGRHGEGADGGTMFDEGVRRAEKVAAMMAPGATVSVVLAEHSPRVVTPLPVLLVGDNSEWTKVLSQLRETKPGMTDANIPAAVETANELAGRGRNLRKLVVVISDDQRSNWNVGNEVAWHSSVTGKGDSEVPVLSMPVAVSGKGPNVSVGSVAVQPAFLGINRPALVTASVTNTGAGDMGTVPVELIVDGRVVGNQQVSKLGPGQSNTVRFDYYFTEAGSHWLRVKANVVDGLEADNAATAAVTVSPRLPVLIVDGQLTPAPPGGTYAAAAFLTFAMQPMDPTIDTATLVSPKVISVAELGKVRFEDYPIVLLNDVPRLPGEVVSRLLEYTQKGNGLWIILGARTEPSFVNGILAQSPLFPAEVGNVVQVKPDAAPVEIDIKEPENAAMALVTAAQRNALAGASLRAWWPLKNVAASMHVILATTTGDPLATEMDVGKSGGRVIVWTSSASDVAWNNLPLVPNFVPLVNETLFHLASGEVAAQVRQLDAGAPLVWSGPATPQISSAMLTGPDGAAHPLQPQLRGDKYFVGFKDTFMPGLYELRFSPADVPQPVYYSVGIDKAEFDPAVVNAQDMDWLKEHHYLKDRVTLETLPAAIKAQRSGFELWWIFGLAVLALLIGEVVMTWRLARKQTDVNVERAGMVTLVAPAARMAEKVGGGAR